MTDVLSRIPDKLCKYLKPAYCGPVNADDKTMMKQYGPDKVSVCQDGVLRWWSAPEICRRNFWLKVFIMIIAAVSIPIYAYLMCTEYTGDPSIEWYRYFWPVVADAFLLVCAISSAASIYSEYRPDGILAVPRQCVEISGNKMIVYGFNPVCRGDLAQFFGGCYPSADDSSEYWTDKQRTPYVRYLASDEYRQRYENWQNNPLRSFCRRGREMERPHRKPQVIPPAVNVFDLNNLVSAKYLTQSVIRVNFINGLTADISIEAGRGADIVMAVLNSYLSSGVQKV